MATIPLYEIGRDTSTLTLQKLVDTGGGVLGTSGSLYSLLTTVESCRVATRNRLVNLSPMKRRLENNVVVESGTTMTFAGLVIKNTAGNGARTLSYGAAAADYVQAHWVEGSAEWYFTAVLESYEQETNKEGSRYTLTLRTVDDLTTTLDNPAVTNP